MKPSHNLSPVFDEPNLVATAGLVPALDLADRSGLTDLLDDRLTVPSPNRTVKARTLIAGMLAGANDIDGLDVLRSGGTKRVLDGCGLPRRWARSCAASPMATSCSWPQSTAPC